MGVYKWPRDGGLSVAGGVTGKDGQILFIESNQIQSDTNLHWDNAAKELGIGTAAPDGPLEVSGYMKFPSEVHIGSGAGASDTGTTMVCIGKDAGTLADSSQSLMIGYQAGMSLTTGTNTLAIGYRCLEDTTASNNQAVGTLAMFANTTGGLNTALGVNAGREGTTQSQNTFIGANAGRKYNDLGSVFIGSSAGHNAISGIQTVCLGNQAGENLSTGGNNLFMAARAGLGVSTGTVNVAVGVNTFVAGEASQSVALGANSCRDGASGINNTVGYKSGS